MKERLVLGLLVVVPWAVFAYAVGIAWLWIGIVAAVVVLIYAVIGA